MGTKTKNVALAIIAATALFSACSTTSRSVNDGKDTDVFVQAIPAETSGGNTGDADVTSTAAVSAIDPEMHDPNLSNSAPADEAETDPYELLPGTGNFINRQAARRSGDSSISAGDVVLNFEKSDLQEVIKTILGDILHVTYMIDPGVSGTVSLATARPIGIDAVIPTLEALLRMNDAVLTRRDGIYFVAPDSKALIRSMKPKLRPSDDGGYQILILPLRYAAVGAMQTILQPLLSANGILAVDPERNHLIIGGTQSELEHVLDTVDIFDVDQMTGMSFGLFVLQTAEATSIRDELQDIFGVDAHGPLAGMVRFVTIDRLNALIVITPQKKYLADAKDWIERLDRADVTSGLNMYVYRVQNGRADHLADLLSQLFADRAQTLGRSSSGSGFRSPSPMNAAQAGAAAVSNATLSLRGLGDASADVGDVKIISDSENNSLVIMATRADYAKITSAIRRLDVLPLQVLVEATIVEVSLTDELSYGLQWFFKNGFPNSDSKQGLGELFPLTVDPSFSYTVTGSAGDTRAVLNLLAADSRLNVISSPSLMVLDNHTATIKVGDQVPVRTSETTSLATSGADPLITSTIQYRDTGVLLEVTPRVNLGGMIVLEITQDVNDVDQTTTSEIDSPTIIQRRITTTVAVQSGETVVLGGLIRENESESNAGIPGLRSIPGIGRLFGSKTTNKLRTELLVLITPTAVTNSAEAREVSREMKRKMSGIDFSRFQTTTLP